MSTIRFRNALMSALLGCAILLTSSPGVAQSTAPAASYALDELETLVGPIALYPDDVLAVLLPASTYPLQIVEAQRFLDTNPAEGAEPDADWDPTVIAMLNYPEALALMSEDLEWTATLGDAVLAQENDVLEAIERFRDAAWLAGNLESNERQTVVRSAESIEILPAEPDVIYLPYYDPVRVVVRQPAPVIGFYDWGYPLYYHAYPSAFVFDRLFFRVPTFYEISWRHRYLHLFGFDYGFWWNRRARFYGYAPRNVVRYNRFQRGFGPRGLGLNARRWQHHPRAGVRASGYHRYGARDRGARANQGYTVRRTRSAPAVGNQARGTVRSGADVNRYRDRGRVAADTRRDGATTADRRTRSTQPRIADSGQRTRQLSHRGASQSRARTDTRGADASRQRYSTRGNTTAAPRTRSDSRFAAPGSRANTQPRPRESGPRVSQPSPSYTTRSRATAPRAQSAPTTRSSGARASAPRSESRAAPRSSGSRASSSRSQSRSAPRSSSRASGSGRSRASGSRGGRSRR